MFKIGLENREKMGKKKKKKKKNELHLLACSAALGPSGDALTICFSCAAGRLPAP